MERAAGIEPAYSAWKADVLPLNYARIKNRAHRTLKTHKQSPKTYQQADGAGGWIRTTEAFASDLQSDPFGRSGTPALMPTKRLFTTQWLGLRIGADERSRTPDRLITSQLLYQLSYISFTFVPRYSLPLIEEAEY